MKKIIALLLLLSLALSCAYAAETDNVFTCDAFSVALPADIKALEADALEGYEAAAEADYPDSGTTVLVAADDAGARIAYFALSESESGAEDAARNAARKILGSDDGVDTFEIGKNTFYGFACAIESRRFDLYFIRAKDALLIINFTGLDADEIGDCLRSLSL